MAHGGGNIVGNAGFGPQPAGATAFGGPPLTGCAEPGRFQGFTYLLGQPTDAQRSSFGDNPNAREIFEELYKILEFDFIGEYVNDDIPAGYTYLLQFIAHDLVETTVPFWAAATAGIESRNMRSGRLLLDTLYGGGPTTCPMAFKSNRIAFPHVLRLGKISDAAELEISEGPCPFRDLARLKDDATVFVADIRNDDTLILAQLVVLFSILHNALAGRLDTGISAPARFEYARAALVHMYHNIITNDLLWRILHEDVLKNLRTRQSSSHNRLWNGRDMALEFSHGAFRFGHAMVLDLYRFNDKKQFDLLDILRGPNDSSGGRGPLPSDWIIAWRHFFKFDGDEPQPNFALKFTARKALSLDNPGLLPNVAPNTPARVTIRDWMSAAEARMWRPGAMISRIQKNYPEIKFFLTTREIRKWLNNRIKTAALSKTKAVVGNAAAKLASDPPLPLYVLLEASLDATHGRRLGPLGSVIVGEVLFRYLAEAKDRQKSGLSAAETAFGDDWQKIDSVKCMPGLIRLAEKWGGLADCPRIPFIT